MTLKSNESQNIRNGILLKLQFGFQDEGKLSSQLQHPFAWDRQFVDGRAGKENDSRGI